MPIYERTGMISHRHPFYGYGYGQDNGSEDEITIQEPDVLAPDASIMDLAPAPPVVSEKEITTTQSKLSTPFTISGVLLSAAEITALTVLWRSHKQTKTWPWYVLAGFVGLRAIGSTVGLIEVASGNKNV